MLILAMSDSAGDALFNITEELDLTILNDESLTFCRNYAGNSVGSILDLALKSLNAQSKAM